MPLNIQALKTTLMTATLGATDANVAMKKMGDAITEYILTNALVNFGWVAFTVPPPLPDPVIATVGKMYDVAVVLTPSKMTSAVSAMAYLANEIRLGVSIGTYTPDAPWSCSYGTMLDIPILVLTPSGVADRDASFLHMATEIYTWITSYVPTVTCSGAHGAYIGVATPVSIM